MNYRFDGVVIDHPARLNRGESEQPAHVVMLPFAGAHCNSYRTLQQELKRMGIGSTALELPGHGSRFSEPLCRTIDGMVDDLDTQLIRQEIACDRVVIAGHSMGSVLAWQLSVRLCDRGLRPHALFLSGRGGPGAPRRREHLHSLPRARFVEHLREFGGCPHEVMENEEMLDLLEPILRADFESLELSPRFAVRPLPIPVTVAVGARDTVTREDAAAWRLITSEEFALHVQPGGHFHLLEEARDTARLMAALAYHTTGVLVS